MDYWYELKESCVKGHETCSPLSEADVLNADKYSILTVFQTPKGPRKNASPSVKPCACRNEPAELQNSEKK